MAREVKVFEVVYDSGSRGGGPAGDGTLVYRSRVQRDAQRFAQGRDAYGQPATVQVSRVPADIAARWGV